MEKGKEREERGKVEGKKERKGRGERGKKEKEGGDLEGE